MQFERGVDSIARPLRINITIIIITIVIMGFVSQSAAQQPFGLTPFKADRPPERLLRTTGQ